MIAESFAYIFLVLELLQRKAMGRYTLSDKTGLSKARIRSILNSLHKDNYVQTNGKSSGRRGTSLTSDGKQILRELHEILHFYSADDITIPDSLLNQNMDTSIAATIVNADVAINKSKSIFLRDVAVRNGADGAIICNWNDATNSFVFPEDQTPLQITIINQQKTHDDMHQVLIIAFGSSEGSVNISVVKTALDLIDLQYYSVQHKFSYLE